MLHHESLCLPFQGAIDVGHDFVARQCWEVREEMSLRAAIHHLGGRRTESGGGQDSVARIGRGVDRKQLVTHLYTCRQWTSILLRRPLVSVNRSAPYERIGNIKQ